jgi:hypothetical protein
MAMGTRLEFDGKRLKVIGITRLEMERDSWHGMGTRLEFDGKRLKEL